MKEVGAARVQFGRGFRFSEQYQKTLPVLKVCTSYKIKSSSLFGFIKLKMYKIVEYRKNVPTDLL